MCSAIVLSRQNVRTLNEVSVDVRREGVLRGGYVAKREKSANGPEIILMASGSEVQWAMDASVVLGDGCRVVSMPCFERFDRQDADYRQSVLPAVCTRRVAIEAGVSGLWYKYVGLDGRVVGTDRFGISAPGEVVMKEFGITAENLVEVAKGLM